MARVYDSELSKVREYLSEERRESYADFQQAVVGQLTALMNKSALKGRIAEVRSRTDAAGKPRLKTEKKIALKLRRWIKERKARDKIPKVADIHDIAAATLICFYPSDVDLVTKFIEDNPPNAFEIFDEVRVIDTPDYYAVHMILQGKGNYLGATCELQIKTIFTQSWGQKTHDIIYKPPGDIAENLRIHMLKLSNTLRLLDEQSEIVKNLIEEAWRMDRRRRVTAQKSLLSATVESLHPELQAIKDYWSSHEDAITSAEADSAIIIDLDAMFLKAKANTATLTLDLCRLISVYALTRISRDRNDSAIDLIDEYIGTLKRKSISYKQALVVRCNAAMSMGEYEECLDGARRVCELADKENPKGLSALKAYVNYAYYLSEAYYHRAFDEPTGQGKRDTSETDDCATQALKIIKERVNDIDGKDQFEQMYDTVGAVLISCGSTEDEIRKGLDYCRKAVEAAPDKDIQKMLQEFFDLHERRAFRRLLQMDPG